MLKILHAYYWIVDNNLLAWIEKSNSCVMMIIILSFLSVLTFGFEPVVYNVSESAGSVSVSISFISGDAGEFVPHVNVSTVDGTATGKYGIDILCIGLVANDATMCM